MIKVTVPTPTSANLKIEEQYQADTVRIVNCVKKEGPHSAQQLLPSAAIPTFWCDDFISSFVSWQSLPLINKIPLNYPEVPLHTFFKSHFNHAKSRLIATFLLYLKCSSSNLRVKLDSPIQCRRYLK